MRGSIDLPRFGRRASRGGDVSHGHCPGRRRRSGLLRSGANCAASERKSLDLRRPPRHFNAKQEKRPGKPAYFRTKMHFDPVHPVENVLTRTNRCLLRKKSVTRKKFVTRKIPRKNSLVSKACRPQYPAITRSLSELPNPRSHILQQPLRRRRCPTDTCAVITAEPLRTYIRWLGYLIRSDIQRLAKLT